MTQGDPGAASSVTSSAPGTSSQSGHDTADGMPDHGVCRYLTDRGCRDVRLAQRTGPDEVRVVGADLVAGIEWSNAGTDVAGLQRAFEAARAAGKQALVFARTGYTSAAREFAEGHQVALFGWGQQGWGPVNGNARTLLAATMPQARDAEAPQQVARVLRLVMREELTDRGLAGRLDLAVTRALDQLIHRAASRRTTASSALEAELASIAAGDVEGLTGGPRVFVLDIGRAMLGRLQNPGTTLKKTPHTVNAWRSGTQTASPWPTRTSPAPRRKTPPGLVLGLLMTGLLAVGVFAAVSTDRTRGAESPVPVPAVSAPAAAATPVATPAAPVRPVAPAVPTQQQRLAWGPGACVALNGRSAQVVDCTEPHGAVVTGFVVDAASCPPSSGLVTRADGDQRGVYCLRRSGS